MIAGAETPAAGQAGARAGRADLRPPARTRWSVAALVVLIHVAGIVALVRALSPDLAANVAGEVSSILSVTVTAPPEPTPTPEPSPTARPSPARKEAAAAPPARRATPRAESAPKPKIVVATKTAPPVASTGAADSAGAADKGTGQGAGGVGTGTGSGASGNGTGGGGAVTPLRKIAGDISSARDYPRAGRDLRNGHRVGLLLTVGTDGRVSDCRVTDPSPDPEADRITCALILQRFRFDPARDVAGNPVVGRYRWYQRWFD